MSKIEKYKINSIVAKPSVVNEDDKKPKGYNIFPELHGICALISKKHSGKSTLARCIAKHLIDQDSHVWVWSSTALQDAEILNLEYYCNENGIKYTAHTSMFERRPYTYKGKTLYEKKDLLDEWITKHTVAKSIKITDPDADIDYNNYGIPHRSLNEPEPFCDDNKTFEVEKDYLPLKNLIIIDDLPNELKHGSIARLMRTNVHTESFVLILSHAITDMLPSSTQQFDYALIGREIPMTKLEKIYHDFGLTIPFEAFMAMYRDATAEPYNFFYIDKNTQSFRKNLNTLYKIKYDKKDEDEDDE